MQYTYKNKLDIVDVEQIEAFYASLELTPVEQHPLWHTDVESKKAVYFIAYENDQIVCCSVIHEKKIGPIGFATIHFGPLFKEPDHLVSSIVEIKNHYKKKYFLFLSIQLATVTGAITDLIEAKLYKQTKFKNIFDRNNWTSIAVKLEEHIEEIFKNFSKGHKSAIKKAIKANVVVRQAESLVDIKELSKIYHKMQSARRINGDSIANIESSFLKIFEFLMKRKKGFVLVVIDDSGKIIGGTINVFQGKGVRYFKGAADPDKRDIPVLHAAIFESIKISKNMNYQYFDLWGYNHYVDKNDQVYNINVFKKGFGGEFIFYPKIMYVELLPFGYFIYKLLFGLNKKMQLVLRSKTY